MRLAKLKLAGFKSFVDPTTVTFPSSLTGVVGPNGCGKSNIIDAVRWVMGEISAKHLRGDSMADVVFNGSVARKPLGTASVELIFDNSEGKIGGQYANYAEISLRRSVSRDGTSDYFINGTKVRRKDITQLFLGTGLGSRSYAIIEQGMISRIVEAKPDDLRAFLEEAAGISRYKERRRETENRISQTRENLERLNDLREEVDKQIRHLQRQAATARRYQALKEEERKLHAEVLALKLHGLDAEAVTKDAAARENDTVMHAAIADLREAEAMMERIRADQLAKADVLAQTQGRFYEAGAEAARIEQNLQHSREIRQTQQNELAATAAQSAEIAAHVQRDRAEIDRLAAELAALGPDLDAAHGRESTAAAALEAAEAQLAEWQRSADAHATQISAAHRETEVERARIEELENQQRRLLQQRERLQLELATSGESDSVAQLLALESRETEARDAGRQAQGELEELLASLNLARDQDRTAGQSLQDLRSRWQTALGRQVSLDALQQAALGKAAGKVSLWLKSQSLDGQPRLAQQLRVERGWERAVETVLGSYLEAVCVEGIDSVAGLLESFDGGQVAFITLGQASANSGETGTLHSKVQGANRLDSILGTVFIAASLRDALSRRAALGTGESVITQDGVWMGRDWLRVSRDLDPRAGVIEREESLRELSVEVTRLAAQVKLSDTELAAIRERIQDLEDRRERSQVEVNRLHREHVDMRAGLESGRARQTDREQRRARIDTELADIKIELASADEALRAARARMQVSIEQLAGLEPKRIDLDIARERLRAALAEMRSGAQIAQMAARSLAVQLESRRSSHGSLCAGLERTLQQATQLAAKHESLAAQLAAAVEPLNALESALAVGLQLRAEVEQELRTARIAADEFDSRLREQDEARLLVERKVESARELLDASRLAAQEVKIRREGVAEQFAVTRFELAAILAALAPAATLGAWEAELADTAGKIERLGQVNLAAIDEFKEQSERKEYLDRQYKDLTDALETLETAIKKIDRETRTRFQDTFNRVNAGLKEKFPRLFGGGHAYLELEGEDSLAAGVSVMARPPGKRNSTISQLSGGEKALTAVALVFSIFDLNPAPFCLLDEVDAPLDDNNVSRFCDIVKDMSKSVQFIFITHNKTTMELASQLIGVTMNEPGVSRLVAVDVDEAMRMAAM